MRNPQAMIIKSKFGDYPVIFSSFEEVIKKYEGKRIVYVMDRNVHKLHHEKFRAISKDEIYLFDADEKNKSPEESFRIIGFFEDRHIDRSCIIAVIGGGITQEAAGFACCIFLRGLKWILFPTTLLAMSDSCIGGKCGLNYNGAKNRVGVFYPPSETVIDTGFLSTLSCDRIIDGEGEIIKSCLLSPEYASDAFSFSEDAIAEYIKKALYVKKGIIETDETEGGRRMLLNFGHTFGHALEAYTENRITHGKAVLWGMDIAMYVSMRMGYLNKADYIRAVSLIKSLYDFDIKIASPDLFLDFLKKDKKTRGKSVFFIMLKGFGEPFIENIEIDGCLRGLFLDWLAEN